MNTADGSTGSGDRKIKTGGSAGVRLLGFLEVLLQKCDGFRPRLLRRLEVRFALALLSEEAVAGAVEDVRGVGFSGVFHCFRRRVDGRGDAGIVAAVKTRDRSVDALDRVG